jgi:hypothetical protein
LKELAKLDTSHERIVEALVIARDSDPDEDIRELAAKVLLAPVHQEVLNRLPPDWQEKEQEALFKCEQCGREGVPTIFACPERPSGGCPFVEEWRKKTGSPLLIMSSIAVLVGLCLVASYPGISVILLAAALISVVIFLNVEEVVLYNSNSGVRLQRTTLWGTELSYKWITSGKPVTIDLELPQPFCYPPSMTALPTELYRVRMEQAVAILRTTLIGLLAQGHIQIHHSQSYVFNRRGVLNSVQDDYSIVAAQEFDQARVKGWLERKIKSILANWSQQKQAKEWSDGPSVYSLVRAIYGRDVVNPQDWLTQLVAKDAAAQGWGQITKRPPWTRFEWDATHANQLQQEGKIIKALSQRLSQLRLNLSREMDKQIGRGIRSRGIEDYE